MEIGFKGVNHIKGRAKRNKYSLEAKVVLLFRETISESFSEFILVLQYLCQETWHKWKTSKNPFVRVENKSFRRLGENIILREQGIHFPWKTFIPLQTFSGRKRILILSRKVSSLVR